MLRNSALKKESFGIILEINRGYDASEIYIICKKGATIMKYRKVFLRAFAAAVLGLGAAVALPQTDAIEVHAEETEFVPGEVIIADGLSVRDYDHVEVADSSIAEAEIIDTPYEGVRITAVAPGTTEVRILNAQDHVDRMFVKVDDNGEIRVEYGILWTGWSGLDDKYRVDGELANGWTKDMGHWYYFVDGVAQTGWFQDMEDDGNWYYLKETKPGRGVMQTGWITDSTGWKRYYLDTNGRMRHSQWIHTTENSFYGPAGYYYLTDDGAVQMNGWAESVTPGIYWYVRPTDGWFDINNSGCWSTQKLW